MHNEWVRDIQASVKVHMHSFGTARRIQQPNTTSCFDTLIIPRVMWAYYVCTPTVWI